MRYTVTITQQVIVKTLTERRVGGAEMAEVCETFGITPEEDWEKQKYVALMVPEDKAVDTTIFTQSFDSIDLSEIVMLLNTPKGGDAQ